MRLRDAFVLTEDSRGSIVRMLRLPREFADAFHNIDPKRSFALANAFRFWTVATYGEDAMPSWANRGDEWVMSAVVKNSVRGFMEEYGQTARELMRRDQSVEKRLKSAKSMDDVKDALRVGSGKEREVVLDLGGGWSWVRLSQEDCEGEGQEMQHCATDFRGDLVSLRDPQGKPHVTMTWNESRKAVYQIKGKQNRLPMEKYWPAIGKFFEHTKSVMADAEVRTAYDTSFAEFLDKHAAPPPDIELPDARFKVLPWRVRQGSFSYGYDDDDDVWQDRMRRAGFVPMHDYNYIYYPPEHWEESRGNVGDDDGIVFGGSGPDDAFASHYGTDAVWLLAKSAEARSVVDAVKASRRKNHAEWNDFTNRGTWAGFTMADVNMIKKADPLADPYAGWQQA